MHDNPTANVWLLHPSIARYDRMATARLLHSCYMTTARPVHSCCTTTAHLLHNYYTVAAQLLHGSLHDNPTATVWLLHRNCTMTAQQDIACVVYLSRPCLFRCSGLRAQVPCIVSVLRWTVTTTTALARLPPGYHLATARLCTATVGLPHSIHLQNASMRARVRSTKTGTCCASPDLAAGMRHACC